MSGGANLRLGELFSSSNGDFDIQKNHINGKGELVITAGLSNNGILGKTDVPAKIFNAKTITIDMFGNAFYRQFKYKIVTHARVFSLEPLFNLTDSQGLFFSIAFHFLHFYFGYENMCSWEKIKDFDIQLPITSSGEIDFDFMESFIRELEEERIRELAAYLKVSGFDNYELSKSESFALAHFNELKWKEFKVGELFEILSYKKRFDANKVRLSQTGHPYIVRTALNNGMKGYLNEDEKYLNDGNTISFGQDTATMFYQEKPYFTGDKIKILKPKNERFNKLNSMFFITEMTKAFSNFSWGSSSFSIDVISGQIISLPVTDAGEIDFDFMETFISAVQKLVIKDVVLYADQKIAATKEAVKK